jgi:hypothetical protein
MKKKVSHHSLLASTKLTFDLDEEEEDEVDELEEGMDDMDDDQLSDDEGIDGNYFIISSLVFSLDHS